MRIALANSTEHPGPRFFCDDDLFGGANVLSAKFDYYELLLTRLKKPGRTTGLRNAALEHLVLGVPVAESARRHDVLAPNVHRLVKQLKELDDWVELAAESRDRMQR
jgi:hypothetical protein